MNFFSPAAWKDYFFKDDARNLIALASLPPDLIKPLIVYGWFRDSAQIRQLLEDIVPNLTTSEYSSLFKGLRFALSRILKKETDPRENMGTRWRVDLVPVHDYLTHLFSSVSYAFDDEKVRLKVIQLPQVIFSETLLTEKEYFKDLDSCRLFADLDGSSQAYPEWVIRIKKVWNLLFLLEKICLKLENPSADLVLLEMRQDFNQVYNLLFDLDINLFDTFSNVHSIFSKQFSQDPVKSIIDIISQNDFTAAQYFGAYLGYIITQLGSTGNILSFGHQAHEVIPNLLAQFMQKLKELMTRITKSGSVAVDDSQIQKLSVETAKIEKNIERFINMHSNEQLSFFEFILMLLKFISDPNTQEIIQFLKYIANEHQALSLELMRFIKFEMLPVVLNTVENFENYVMMEPGTLVFYVEYYFQQFYHEIIAVLQVINDKELETLYTPNWLMLRQSHLLQTISILEQHQKMLQEDLNFSGSPEEKFKILYGYCQDVDSQATEKIRENIKLPKEQLMEKVTAKIRAQYQQYADQVQLLKAYRDTLSQAIERQVCFFEVKPEKVIDKSCLSITPSSTANEITNALIEYKKVKLKECSLEGLLRSQWAVIKFSEEYFLLESTSEDKNFKHLPEFAMPFPISCQKSVYLPGKLLNKISFASSAVVDLSPDTIRFSLQLHAKYLPKQKNYTPDQLTADELFRLSLAYQQKYNRIQDTLSMMNGMITAIQHSESLEFHYLRLQAVFQWHFESNFHQFHQAFKEKRVNTSEFFNHCVVIQSKLTLEMENSQTQMGYIWIEYQKKQNTFRLEQFESFQPNHRSTYLVQREYSKKFTDALYQLQENIVKHGSSDTHQFLLKLQGDSSAEKYNALKAFPHENKDAWDKMPKHIQIICYAHNVLFYLRQMYQRFETQKKYQRDEEQHATLELLTRLFSIGDFFTFLNFTLTHQPFGLMFQSFHQLVKFERLTQFNQRVSQVYDLRGKPQGAFLNGPMIIKPLIRDLYSSDPMREYLISGQIDKSIEAKVGFLLPQEVQIGSQFEKLSKVFLLKQLKQEIRLLKCRRMERQKSLNCLNKTILEDYQANKWKRARFVIENYLLERSKIQELNLQREFNQKLEEHAQRILCIIDKDRQDFIHELAPMEKIILQLIRQQPLTTYETVLLQNGKQQRNIWHEQNEKDSLLYAQFKKASEPFKIEDDFYWEIKQKKKTGELSLEENIFFEVMNHLDKPSELSLDANGQNFIEVLFTKAPNSLSKIERSIKRHFENRSEIQFSPQKPKFEENLFRKIFRVKTSHLPLQLNQPELDFLKTIKNSPGIFKNLIDFNTLSLRSSNIEPTLECALALQEMQSFYSLKPETTLSVDEILNLPHLQMRMLKFDIYQSYLDYQKNKNHENQKQFLGFFKDATQQALQDLRIIDFREKRLKKTHSATRVLIKHYVKYETGFSFFKVWHISAILAPMLNHLRLASVELRQLTELNICGIQSVLALPILSHLDRVEIELGLKPGIWSERIEGLIFAFMQEFRKQICSSTVYVALQVNNKTSFLKRRQAAVANNSAHHFMLETRIQEAQREPFLQNTIEKQLNECSEKYAQLSRSLGREFLRNDVVFSHFKKYLEAALKNHSQFKNTIQEIASQPQTPFGNTSSQDEIFNQFFKPNVLAYMRKNSSYFQCIDQLYCVLESHKADLQNILNQLKDIDNQFKDGSLTWKEYFANILTYCRITFYYSGLNQEIIEKKLANIVQLETKLQDLLQNHFKKMSDDVKRSPQTFDIEPVVVNFEKYFKQFALTQSLNAQADEPWYPGKFLLKLLSFVMRVFIAVLNSILPHAYQIRLFTPKPIQLHEDMQYTLNGKNSFWQDDEATMEKTLASPKHLKASQQLSLIQSRLS